MARSSCIFGMVLLAASAGCISDGTRTPLPPRILITSPNGGEVWLAGALARISWNSQGGSGRVDILLSTDGGASWTPLLAQSADDGIETVAVPATTSSRCRIKVRDSALGHFDTSDGDFSIGSWCVYLYAQTGDSEPATAQVTVPVPGQTEQTWSASAGESWLSIDPNSGTLPESGSVIVTLSAEVSGLSAGLYATDVTFSSSAGETVVKVALAVRPSNKGAGYMLYYVSRIDGSLQPYGLYLPSSYSRGTPAPLVIKLHGYGGHASSSFSQDISTRADARGWLVVNLEGRGNHFYDGPAETDLFEVIDDVDKSYGIDRSRIFIEGLSMGATGAYRHITRHPDIFAGAAGSDGWTDFREWHKHWYAPGDQPDEFHPARESNLEYASPLTHAENILPGRLYIGTDGADTIVLPENGIKLHKRLDRLATTHTYVFNPSGGHCATYNQAAMHDFFHTLEPNDPDPPTIRLRSNRLRTARRAWFQVDRFAWSGFADIEAERDLSNGQCVISAHVRNVERFTIAWAPESSSYTVNVNGITCAEFAQGERSFPLTLDLSLDETGQVISGGVYSGTDVLLRKKPSLEGPIARAFCERFIVAWGSSDPNYESKNRSEAEEFCKYWADVWNGGTYGFNATISPVDEKTLSDVALAGANLVIFGSEASSALIDRMCSDSSLPFNLPVRITEDTITFADEAPLTGTQYGIWMVYPNPLAPERLVVVGHNVIGQTTGAYGAIFWTQEAWSWMWPDYVIFDTSAPMRPDVDGQKYTADQYVLAGEFDQNWQPPLAGTPRTVVQVQVTPSTYARGTGPAMVYVTVTNGINPVEGLEDSSFDFWIDGEKRPATLTSASGGTYCWELPIADLDIGPLASVGFDITVEVRRPTANGPAVGRGRARFILTN